MADKYIKNLKKSIKKSNKQAKADKKQAQSWLKNNKTFKYDDTGGLKNSYESAKSDFDYWVSDEGKRAAGFDKYIDNVNDLYGKIMSQEKFSYDPTKDALFQMYKNQYNAQGTQAMKNAMGVGTARSGGYNSSAAQTAAQSTFLGYMDALNDKVADTYQNAMSRYQQNQQNLMNQYNMARDMNNAANDAYYSQLGLKQAALDNASGLYWNDYNRQYTGFTDQTDFNFNLLNNANNTIANNRNTLLRIKGYTG